MGLENKKKFLTNFCYYGILLAGGALALKFGWEYLTPFVIAFIVSFCLKPVVNRVNIYFKIKRSVSAIVCVAAFYLLTGVVISLIGVQVILFIRNMFFVLPDYYNNEIAPLVSDWLHRIQRFVVTIDPEVTATVEEYIISLLDNLGQWVSSLSVTMLSKFSASIVAVPGLFIKTLITIIATFFISVDYYEITFFIARQLNTKQISLLYDAETYAKTALVQYIKSYSLILFITFAEIAAGLWLLGVKRAVLIAMLIAVFDILPAVGTGGIIIPWGIISIALGDVFMGIGLLALYLIVTVVRNTLEPKIVGEQVGLHPVATLMAMFLGSKIMGIIGLFGFPIALVILTKLNDSGKIKLFK
ncbi:MAG: sporulation integral membrane protein YtvI [Oscillospiraceae bacterium]|nr:sporulation integral membrane protein YtvI [Oscillospiraceae bacterium]MBQ6850461.1 sporulation integral membrane protein YtvI [Oscillospiraceae bacterium]